MNRDRNVKITNVSFDPYEPLPGNTFANIYIDHVPSLSRASVERRRYRTWLAEQQHCRYTEWTKGNQFAPTYLCGFPYWRWDCNVARLAPALGYMVVSIGVSRRALHLYLEDRKVPCAGEQSRRLSSVGLAMQNCIRCLRQGEEETVCRNNAGYQRRKTRFGILKYETILAYFDRKSCMYRSLTRPLVQRC